LPDTQGMRNELRLSREADSRLHFVAERLVVIKRCFYKRTGKEAI
jgi:hypothetical protein